MLRERQYDQRQRNQLSIVPAATTVDLDRQGMEGEICSAAGTPVFREAPIIHEP